MTTEQAVALQQNIDKKIPFSLSLYRAVCGDQVNIIEEYVEKRIPEPWYSLVGERIDRQAIMQYALGKMAAALADMQAQLDRIEAKLSQ